MESHRSHLIPKKKTTMELMAFSRTEHQGFLFHVNLVDRCDAGEQRWRVEVQMLNAKDSPPIGAVAMLSEEFISVEAPRSAGNNLARILIEERSNVAG
jgi:hypothetical protein